VPLEGAGAGAGAGAGDLEGFEALLKTHEGQACVMVIEKVLKRPQIFVFGELLDLPNVKNLANGPHRPWLELLKLFAYGTFADYKARSDLPKLEPAQLTKLKQLSIVEYASKSKELSYSMLMSMLDINNVRELEDLIIDAVYAGLCSGKLDQRRRSFLVRSVIGRDLGPNEVESMANTLSSWLQSSESLLKTLEKKSDQAQIIHDKRKKETQELEKQKKDITDQIKEQIKEPNSEALAAMMMGGEVGRGFDDPRRPNRRHMERGLGMPRKMLGRRNM